MDRGAGDSAVTELLNGVEFESFKNGICKSNGYTQPYKNGYINQVCNYGACLDVKLYLVVNYSMKSTVLKLNIDFLYN